MAKHIAVIADEARASRIGGASGALKKTLGRWGASRAQHLPEGENHRRALPRAHRLTLGRTGHGRDRKPRGGEPL
jgi:hypothetical protein